jgi:hypothetical protein
MPDKYAVDHSDKRDLDELLDRALASYVDQEPDPSLRTRVFARINEAAPPLRRMWPFGWLAAAACTAAVLFAFLLHPADRTVPNQAANAPAIASAPPQTPAASAKLDHTLTHSAHPRIVAASRRGYNNRKAAPYRPSISLGSAPLTEEEMILLRFAQQNPEQARQVLSPPPSGPLHTDPLVIAPIQIADLSGSQSDAH